MTHQNTELPLGAVELAVVVIRGCDTCGTGRPDPNLPCPGCGNPDPPRMHDLGVIAATYSDPVRATRWRWFGNRRATRRIKQANRAK